MAIIVGNKKESFSSLSYASIEFADKYFEYDLNASIWADLDEEIKKKALVTATKQIDTLNFYGVKLKEDQPLQFPRVSQKVKQLTDNQLILYKDQIKAMDVIPEDVMKATCEQALTLVKNQNTPNDFADLQAQNVQSYTIGDVSISFNVGGSNKMVGFSTVTQKLLNPYIVKYTRLV